ncbi:hypothetical protein PFICI_07107 [Pestalotiopsis fici W106-1]|uniref:Heterokaryon incompatibility domain-containing protein n=1 Tax=Pestalotiopsis fici (strain W106-1 / CGMCC3.15140) TaxID=1229662 RepID=W3X7S5_PESFW|nr:uncharacterized protein PFICI_07107 [Pestalotiopsis fici W106-1]ETS82105.1 hypothetical protein PFICI_07107 [Pestalotiopsis fici W106-1]
MSVLCRKCQVIQINDAEHNGIVQTSASGKQYVSIGIGDDGDHDFKKRLLLDYELSDTLPDLPNLSQSAADGCALCSVIKNEIIRFLGKNAKYTQLLIHKVGYYLNPDPGDKTKPGRNWLHAMFVYFKLQYGEEFAGEDAAYALRLEVQASSTGLERLKKLADTASSVALRDTDNLQLPTRLIDVGLRGPTREVEEPRLVITADYPPLKNEDGARRYNALSYCWGPPEKAKKQLKTETSTLNDRLCQIPLSSMPAAHQDAVLVCRALGIPYVWIDSLCIIQDDKVDWEREAQKMGSVYANAFLTICAAQGDSCLDSFLRRTVPSQVVDVPFTSSIDPSVSGRFSLFVAPDEDPYKHIARDYFGGGCATDFLDPWKPLPTPYRFATSSYDPYNMDIPNCNWSRRGWTLQESILAPRALLFGARMVHVCIGGLWLESEDGSSSDRPFWPPIHLRAGVDEKSAMADTQVEDAWRFLAREYSSRSLTYRSDTFPALSAIAQVWHQMIKGQYLAGLFSSNLHLGLLWRARFGMRTPKQFLEAAAHEQYIAPSWSWASKPYQVTWVFHVRTSFRPKFELLCGAVTVDGVNPYGRLTSGHLLLSTKICKIPSTRLRRVSVFFGFIFPYELLTDDGRRLAHVVFDWRQEYASAPKDPETEEELEDGPIDCLSMVLVSSKATDAKAKIGKDGDVTYQDLLIGLLVLPTGKPGEYKRAGLFFTEESGLCGSIFWDSLEHQKVRLV